jgi:hypothetical protein
MGHYELRFQKLKEQLFEIVDAFDTAGLEFVMLKGLSHAPALTADAQFRGQGDIDLWLPRSSAYIGQDILQRLGYEPTRPSKSRHLSPMARPTSWQWRGDLFDPDMPISVELHHELWSEDTEYITISQLYQFWERKVARDFDGYTIHVLCDADLVGFACLHFLLHLLHGEVPLQRAWEIARFLEIHADDHYFWTSWRILHSADLRNLETCVFCLIAKWFSCRVSEDLLQDLERLPAGVKAWLAEFPLHPLRNEWASNKSELWLHLALIRKRINKLRILFRRLFPQSVPDPSRALWQRVPFGFVLTRLTRHLVTFFPTLFQGLSCFLRSSRKLGLLECDGRSNARFAAGNPRASLPNSTPSEERV